MDCENCRHLTVVGLHDTGPRAEHDDTDALPCLLFTGSLSTLWERKNKVVVEGWRKGDGGERGGKGGGGGGGKGDSKKTKRERERQV